MPKGPGPGQETRLETAADENPPSRSCYSCVCRLTLHQPRPTSTNGHQTDDQIRQSTSPLCFGCGKSRRDSRSAMLSQLTIVSQSTLPAPINKHDTFNRDWVLSAKARHIELFPLVCDTLWKLSIHSSLPCQSKKKRQPHRSPIL